MDKRELLVKQSSDSQLELGDSPCLRSSFLKQQSESKLVAEAIPEDGVRMRSCMNSRSKSCLKQSSPYVSDDDESFASCSTRSSKNVSFHKIEITSIPMQLGDNPCAEGIPVTLGWEANRTDVFDLEAYEECKPERRTGTDLHLPPVIRHALITSSGDHSREEIAAAIKEAERIQKSRCRSIKNQKWDGINFAFESVKRKVSHGRGRRSSIPGGMPPLSPKDPNTGRARRRSSMTMVTTSSESLDGAEHKKPSRRRSLH